MVDVNRPPGNGVAVEDASCILLCGGRSRRLGHSDKTAAALGDSTVLDALLDSLPPSWPVVAVGRPRETRRRVAWTREQPEGGGPVAAIAAGLEHVTTPVVVVVAGDMPFAGAAVSMLAGRLTADASVEAVVGMDRSGRRQPLLTAYRRDALRRLLPSPATGVPAMQLLDGLNHVMFDLGDPDAMDIDTPEQLEEARRRFAP